MNDFDWRLIVTMHELKNLTQTAELFFMSQPALTQRLQKIESELDVTIALRNKKGVTFTEEGEYLSAQGVKILELLQETNLGLTSISGKTKKILRIGAANAFTQKLVNSWWQERFSANPNIAMIAVNGDTCGEMVINGLGYAIFTIQEFAAEDARLYKIPMTNLDGSPFVRNIRMIYKKDYTKNKALCDFMNVTKTINVNHI